jgi:hypothetical protein
VHRVRGLPADHHGALLGSTTRSSATACPPCTT